ncbi:MAG: T9SS type A sorting domain-containing protein [Bacteroidetes bacterium]|nr:T9SS type A sorting domain-containing protein [Bacteroidota bacterium]
MKTQLNQIQLILSSVLIIISLTAGAQISGTVFRDINNDGIQQSTNPTEPGEYGVTVKAYNSVNALLGTVTTDANGYYSFSAAQAPSGLAVRIEFSIKSGDQPSKRIDANHTNVQFVVAGSAINTNFAVADRKWFSDNSNPYVATTAYTNGNALSSGSGTAGDNDNLYVFPYDLSNDGGNTRRAKNKYLGAIFGLAWQRESRTLLMAAYLKVHASFGPNGIGAIYQAQIDKNGIPATPTLLVDVASIGINVGTDPRSSTLPDISSTPNADPGVFAEVGKRGIGGIELSVDGRELYIVNMYQKKLQRINVGNPLKSSFSSSDVTGSWSIPDPGYSGTQWHPMAVEIHNGKIYVGGISTKETTTAHNIADTTNLRGTVYEFNPSTSTFTTVLTFSLTHRRGFTNSDYRYEFRNNYWAAWQNSSDISLGGPLRTGLLGATTGSNATGIYYSQPMLCDIEFDVDGSMIMGIRDRFGDQGGYANYFETGNVVGETYRTLSTGEVLKAGKAGNVWILENNGSVTNNGVTTTTAGLADNTPALTGSFTGLTGTPWGGPIGPGGGYFYYNQNFTKTGVPAPFGSAATITAHYTKSNGGIAVYPGYNEVMMSAIDPLNKSYTNGIIRNFNDGANAGNMSGRMELFSSNGSDPTNFGKAAALGDFELLLDAEAMEIGNKVWDDANANGIQDATEAGIPGVKVVLRSAGSDGVYGNGDDQTWIVTTDSNGNYYFDATIVNDNRRPSSWLGVSATNSGILPGFEYRVEIDLSQVTLTGYSATVINGSANSAIDNNGVKSGTKVMYTLNPGGSTAANSVFSNDYNIDFGFTGIVLPLKQLKVAAVLNENNVNVNWNTVEEFDVKRYFAERSTDGKTFTEAGSLSSKGNGSFSYQVTDDISNIQATTIYYRIRVEELDGKTRYSEVVKVNPGKAISLQVSPNPFTDNINLQIKNEKKTEVKIRIMNSAGQVLQNTTMIMQSGVNSVTLNNFTNYSKGMYVIEITAGEQYAVKRLIKR